MALARKFNREVVAPRVLELDRKKQEDHDFLPWDVVKKANKWGFFTMWLPRFFGGHGYNYHSLFFFLEEIASECVAISNLIGAHYLGACAIFCVWNIRVANEIFRDVAKGEKPGFPACSPPPPLNRAPAPTAKSLSCWTGGQSPATRKKWGRLPDQRHQDIHLQRPSFPMAQRGVLRRPGPCM